MFDLAIAYLFSLLAGTEVGEKPENLRFEDAAPRAIVLTIWFTIPSAIFALVTVLDFTTRNAVSIMFCFFLVIVSFQITALITNDPYLWLLQFIMPIFLICGFLICDVQRYMGNKENKMKDGKFSSTFWLAVLICLHILFIFLLCLRAYQVLWCLHFGLPCVYDWWKENDQS